MKKIQKIGGLLLAGLMGFGVVGCAGSGNGEGDVPAGHENETILRLGNVDAGLGDEWLYAVKAKFEEAYKEVSFEEGKTGVYVEITNKNAEFATSSLVQNMPYNPYDVYVLANASYDVLDAADILADLTDVMTAKNYDDDGNLVADGTGTTSIASRMVDLYEDFYNLGTEETPRYVGVPYHATPSGIIYDADLFNSKKLYLNAAGKFQATAADVEAGNCGKGPDGVLGTYDDGLPETYEKFKELCSTMVARGVTPFVWDAQHTYQRGYAYNYIFANYEGGNDYMLNKSLNGHDNDLNIDITESNGYELLKQPGRLAAYTMIHDIIANSWFYADSMKGVLSHVGAQRDYIYSTKVNKPIAFLLEGGWWENECRDYFDQMATSYGEGYGFGERNFKLLPMPYFVGTEGVADQQNTKHVLTCASAGNSSIYISGNTTKMECAKEFIKFIHSREMLALMSQTSSCLRPFDYTMTEEELAGSTTFFNSMYTMWKDTEGCDVVYDVTTSALLANNASYFDSFIVKGEPFNTFYGDSKVTALSLWQQQVSQYKQTDSIWAR